MPFHDLQSYLRALEEAGELKRVTVEVDPELEITEIATRVIQKSGPALLFERVKGSPYPLVINIFGSARRIELALGASPAELGRDLARLAQSVNPPRWIALWKSRKTLRKVLAMRARRARRAPSQKVMETHGLDALPILKCWPKDAGRFVTFGLVLTEHPRTMIRNVGLYRLQLFSPTTLGMHWQIQKGGGFHYHEAEKRGQALPVAVAIGADPALLLAAVAPLPEGMDEIAFSGFLRGAPSRLAKAKTIPLRVPAAAEFVLEGVAPPQERHLEGPFGDHFGHYSHAAPFPVFHLQQMTRRPKPVFLAAVVGKPPQEDRYLGEATQEIMGPLLKIIRPEIENLWAYYEAGFHNLLVVAVHQRYAKEALKTGLGLLGEGQLSLTKCMILVDPTVDVRDFGAVLQALQQNFDSAEDALILPGVPLDTLDFTSYTMNLGSKMILDATRKIKPSSSKPPPSEGDKKKGVTIEALRAVQEKEPAIRATRLWGDALLVVQIETGGRAALERLVNDPLLEGVKIIAMVSPDISLDDRVSVLWGIFTRFDCARDVAFTETRLVGPTVRYSGRLGIDATFKPGYPEPLEMTDAIRERVTRRWSDYGIE